MICISLGNCSLRSVDARGRYRGFGGVHAPLSSMPELLKNLHLAVKSADIIEIRADGIRDFSLPLLLKQKTSKPLIFTCYAKSNGGCFRGAVKERIKLLSSAITSGRFEYVTIDIPRLLAVSNNIKTLINLGRACQTKIILAYHNHQKTPDNLEAIYKRLSMFNPNAIKIVTNAQNFSDNFKVFKLAQTLKLRRHHQPKLIAFCMGAKGMISRILYKKFGLFLTYASYKTGWETADGQMPLSRMKYFYQADSITCRTKIFGLLGSPIQHSYSPFLFNAWFGGEKTNAVYLPLAIDPNRFEEDFSLIKSFLNPMGFSITSPYKITAMKLADRLSNSAKEIGAINTIYCKDNKFIGTNTDWIGVIETLLPWRKLLKNRQALILGQGGAARAIIYALRYSGIKTIVFARKSNKNMLPLKRIAQYCRGSGYDKIIINATPLGMMPDTDKSPIPQTYLKKGMIVFDTIYNPAETRLLRDAKKKGCVTINGLKMFLDQALKQMEYFNRSLP